MLVCEAGCTSRIARDWREEEAELGGGLATFKSARGGED